MSERMLPLLCPLCMARHDWLEDPAWETDELATREEKLDAFPVTGCAAVGRECDPDGRSSIMVAAIYDAMDGDMDAAAVELVNFRSLL